MVWRLSDIAVRQMEVAARVRILPWSPGSSSRPRSEADAWFHPQSRFQDVQGRIVNKGTGRKVIPFQRQVIIGVV